MTSFNSFCLLAFWALGIVQLLNTECHAAAIIGIDFGTEFIKVASVQPGKSFDIVLNEKSGRKEPNAMAFDRGHRLYGSDAVAMAVRRPTAALLRSRDLLGVNASSNEVSILANEYLIKYDIEEGSGSYNFTVVVNQGTPDEIRLQPKEVVGMVLSKVKRMATRYTADDVKDCVLTVPPYWTQAKREALLQSAEIAGLRVLRLLDENVAAAVQHGVYNEFSNVSNKILVYNMGSVSTKVAIFNFWGKSAKTGVKKIKPTTQIEVLSKAWNPTLGGHSLDLVMLNFLADKFDEQHKELSLSPVRENPRAVERLRAQAIKVKTVLSANTEIPVSIESLHGGKDLRTVVSRAEFEAAADEFFAQVLEPIDTALANARLTVSDLHSVELIGGGVRVPRIKQLLSKKFNGMELGNHLNGDEAIAFGAVFVASNISKGFRVRPVGLTDITNQAVSVSLSNVDQAEEESWNRIAQIFNSSSVLGSRKVVSFVHESDFSCEMFRRDSTGDELVSVSKYIVTGVAEAIEKFGEFGKPKISLTFLLSLNDTVGLIKADALFVEEIPPVVEDETDDEQRSESECVDENSGELSEECLAEKVKTNVLKSEQDGDSPVADESAANDSDNKKEEVVEKPKNKAVRKLKPTKKTHRFALKLVKPESEIVSESLEASRTLLASWDDKEAKALEFEAARNDLESFIFRSRDMIYSNEAIIDTVLDVAAKEKLLDDLRSLEDWIDEEGADAPVEEYYARQAEMSERIQVIDSKGEELDQRPATIRAAKSLVTTTTYQVSKVWPVERPWISTDERFSVLQVISSFNDWLKSAEEKQNSVDLTDDSFLSSTEIANRLEELHDVIENALRRSPPLPKIVKPKSEPKKESKSQSDNSFESKSSGESDDSKKEESKTQIPEESQEQESKEEESQEQESKEEERDSELEKDEL